MNEIGQSWALRDIFARVYAATKPRRLLILGCTTGKDLEDINPDITHTTVGIDVNREYLEAARERVSRLRGTATLLHSDVLDLKLTLSAFDLIHAALILEYVDPGRLFCRVRQWLSCDGVCSVVTQNPVEGVASVSKTAQKSLLLLDGYMSLYGSDQINAFAIEAGLQRVSTHVVQLPLGKSFTVSMFRL